MSPSFAPSSMNAAITSVYIVIAVCTPWIVVSRSSTICEIATFMTLESSTITNCAEAKMIIGSHLRTNDRSYPEEGIRLGFAAARRRRRRERATVRRQPSRPHRPNGMNQGSCDGTACLVDDGCRRSRYPRWSRVGRATDAAKRLALFANIARFGRGTVIHSGRCDSEARARRSTRMAARRGQRRDMVAE